MVTLTLFDMDHLLAFVLRRQEIVPLFAEVSAQGMGQWGN